jgi:hypothetical protein
MRKLCTFPGCGLPHSCKGLCKSHYVQQWSGKPLTPIYRTAEARFNSYLIRSIDGCLLWTGGKNTQGDGNFWHNGRTVQAHRFAYEFVNGPIPDGHDIHHICENTSCCEPAHLTPLTPRDHVLVGNNPSAINARKTHCINGHALTNANILIEARGSRACRVCRRIRDIVRRLRKLICDDELAALLKDRVN